MEKVEDGGGAGTPDQQQATDFYAMAALIEQLKAEELPLRVAATRELPAIAVALGPERVRSELIPFLTESTDDEDEVLLAAAEQLGNLAGLMGSAHAHLLLEPLEALASVEETAVREKAVESMLQVAGMLPLESLTVHCVPALARMGEKDWFTARISACGLVPAFYGLLKDSGGVRTSLRQLYGRLCHDDTPMVRRVAAASLGRLAHEMALLDEGDIIVEQILPLFLDLASDRQDSVRLQTVDNCIALAEALTGRAPNSDKVLLTTVLPVVLSAAADHSWRVRWSMAAKYDQICRKFFPNEVDEQVSDSFEKLLQDSEAEVRRK
jgi:serine/threonine-protein phosphatase 2A regulatory subunit A